MIANISLKCWHELSRIRWTILEIFHIIGKKIHIFRFCLWWIVFLRSFLLVKIRKNSYENVSNTCETFSPRLRTFQGNYDYAACWCAFVSTCSRSFRVLFSQRWSTGIRRRFRCFLFRPRIDFQTAHCFVNATIRWLRISFGFSGFLLIYLFRRGVSFSSVFACVNGFFEKKISVLKDSPNELLCIA